MVLLQYLLISSLLFHPCISGEMVGGKQADGQMDRAGGKDCMGGAG